MALVQAGPGPCMPAAAVADGRPSSTAELTCWAEVTTWQLAIATGARLVAANKHPSDLHMEIAQTRMG